MKRLLLSLLLTLSMQGVSWASASQDFDGVDDVGDCGSLASLDNFFASPGGTVAAWIYPDNWGESSFGRLFDKTGAITVGPAAFVCETTTQCTGTITNSFALFHSFTGADGKWDMPAGQITLDTWQHVAITYDRSLDTNDPLMYYNGAPVTVTETSTPTSDPEADGANSFLLGNRGDGARTFDGSLSHVHVYNRILSAGEIQQIQHFPGSIVNGLVLYQAIMDTSGFDLSGNGNTCSYTGTTASSLGPPVFLSSPLVKTWNRLMKYVMVRGWPRRTNYTRWHS